MPASLTEEELARLEVNVRTCQRSRMPMTVLPTEQAEKLLASARAVREVLPLLIAVRDDPAMHPKCGFVVRPCIRRAIEILTATEQTAGEER